MNNSGQFMIGTFGAWIVIFIICGGLYGCPKYNVWQQKKAGEAELARADQNRQITITEATAKNQAATSEAEAMIKIAESRAAAEIIRAEGAAKANAIIDSTLTERYLRYRWVEGLNDGNSEVIYVPTEANMPIMEATRQLPRNK